MKVRLEDLLSRGVTDDQDIYDNLRDFYKQIMISSATSNHNACLEAEGEKSSVKTASQRPIVPRRVRELLSVTIFIHSSGETTIYLSGSATRFEITDKIRHEPTEFARCGLLGRLNYGGLWGGFGHSGNI